MRMLLTAAAAAALAVGFAGQAQAQTSATAAPLIERKAFFGNPTRTQGRISPDGRWLSWTAPKDGVMNLWVAPANDLSAARALTSEKRPVPTHTWAPDSSMILFINDQGGDENFRLYGVDVRTGEQRTLTPFDKTRAILAGVSRQVKNRVLVAVNNRDPKWHDVHSLDLKTGKLTLVMQNEGYSDFLADESLTLRVASKSTADGGTEFFRVTKGQPEAKPFASVDLDDSQTTFPAGFTADGETMYWIDSRGRDTAVLAAQDLATGKITVLAQNARADVGEVMNNPKTGRVDAYAVEYLKKEWVGLDAGVAADLKRLKDKLGLFDVTARTDADDVWIVWSDPVTGPAAYWRFDRKSNALTRLFSTRPELDDAVLAPMQALEIKSRDGLTLTSYLTLPPGSDADGDGLPDKAVPLVLVVHGGPWGRDSYGYRPVHQWLANRGYAVLSTNFRASTGLGKSFISAGNLEWGAKMQDDLDDAVDWAVARGVTTKDKVAIFGGSYGGYAVLAGMAFTPDRYACGVDMYGISNMETILATLPPYWESLRQQFYQRMGDPNTAEGKALLRARSPLHRADAIRAPLLIGQGMNDPRVTPAESEQIVAAMKAKGIPVTYVTFPDEGHGWRRPENNIAFMAVSENFLQPCLGGRAEPIGAALKASTMKVEHGAAYAPGLEAASTR